MMGICIQLCQLGFSTSAVLVTHKEVSLVGDRIVMKAELVIFVCWRMLHLVLNVIKAF
jgi:hypothetical protein